jgi:hypothetical protein
LRPRGEITEAEEDLLGIERLTEEQEAEAEQELKQKLEIRRNFLRQLMTSSDFRAWLWEFLNEQGTFEHRFGTSPMGFPDNLATWHALGMKQAGMNLFHQFDDAAPDLCSLMRRETGKG